ncbi:MAG: pyruvate kinase [Bacilli bacterium]|nr:pyruvate kinase [Bacilli bacterium]
MKKTKIICSIGPSSCNPDTMESMVKNGMNVARINFSHATLEEKQNVVATVKEVRKRTGVQIGILYDTKGPEFRNGNLENDEIKLIEGNTIKIVKEDVLGNTERFSVNHPSAIDSLKIGNEILLENGLMKIEVIEKDNDSVTCKIINGGVLGNKKSLSVPGVHLDIPFISDIDREDITYACNHDGDFLALSFVSTKEDVLEARKILIENNREDLKIISKIESVTGIENLDEIIEVSDGIMVARGDLGVEAKMEDLPILQKMIIKKCREQGKIAVVATEMLESMKKSVRPTRAEVSDVANAVLDGTDAVMLSGETTTGKYPIETVGFMANICENTEGHVDFKGTFDYKKKIGLTQTISTCVVESAEMLESKLIVAATISGFTARKISNLKPNCPILAACPNEDVCRSLSLNYGVYTTNVPVLETTDAVISQSLEKAKEFIELKKRDTVIITGGFPNTGVTKTTNLMKIEEI